MKTEDEILQETHPMEQSIPLSRQRRARGCRVSESRKRFEDWYEAYAMPLEADWFRRDPEYPDEYKDVQGEWEAWQAGAKSQERELAEARDDRDEYIADLKRKLAEERRELADLRDATVVFRQLPGENTGGEVKK